MRNAESRSRHAGPCPTKTTRQAQLAAARVDTPFVRVAFNRPGDEAVAYHLVLRVSDGRPIAPTAEGRRVLARVVLEQGAQRGLLGFGLGHDHLHIEAAATRVTAGELARYVATALRARLGLRAPFAQAWIERTRDQKHLRNRLLYAMGQDRHHRGGWDPTFDATSLPDLIGLRAVDSSIGERVRRHVPRLDRAELLGLLPPDALSYRGPFDLGLIAEAAAAAFALRDLSGRSPTTVVARHAAVLAAGPNVTSRELARRLGIGQRAIQRMRAVDCDKRVIDAVRGQLWIRSLLARPRSNDQG